MLADNQVQLWLAPMEGVVDPTMRRTLTDIGGLDVCVTEFVRVTQQPLPQRTLLKFCPELAQGAKTQAGTQVRIQFLGNDISAMSETAKRAISLGAKHIDVNFGCPAKTVNKNYGGAALLKHPQMMTDILRGIKTAIGSDVVLSAKIRLGFDSLEESQQIVKAVHAANIDQLTIHARTKSQGYKPPAYWSEIYHIKQQYPDLDIIANGEIWTVEDFARCQEQSGCDKFMLGRGLLANPFLATQIREFINTGHYSEVTWLQVAPLLLLNAEEMISHSPKTAYFSARTKQWLTYLKLAFPEAKEAFSKLRTIRCPHTMLDEITKLC